MIKRKRFISGLLILAVIATSTIGITTTTAITITTVAETELGTIPGISYKYFQYLNHEDYIEITGYADYSTPSNLIIPDTINDLPVKKIGEDAFSRKTMQSVNIPEGVTEIGVNAFFNCTKLTDITIPESVESIGASAFAHCPMTSITIPESLTEISSNLFDRCYNLKNITIPKNIKSIGDWAFIGCNSCEYIEILNPECEIYDGTETFQSNITIYGYKGSTAEAYASAYNRSFVAIDSESENTSTTTTEPITTTTISTTAITTTTTSTTTPTAPPTTATPPTTIIMRPLTSSVGIYNGNIQYHVNEKVASYNPYTITTVVAIIECNSNISGELEIPETIDGLPVIDIRSSAFSKCSKLDSIILPESVKNISNNAFNSNLKKLTIKNPECEIYSHWDTIPESTVIYGYADSTAQQYAQTFNREFIILDGQSSETTSPATTTTPPETTTTPARKFGDIDGNGFVDASDASLILAYYAYTSTGGTADLEEYLELYKK